MNTPTVKFNNGFQLVKFGRLTKEQVAWLVGQFPHGTMRNIAGLSVELYNVQGIPIFRAIFDERHQGLDGWSVSMVPALLEAAKKEFGKDGEKIVDPRGNSVQ